MDVVQRWNCLFGRHHRDGRRVRVQGDVHRSFCIGCGKPMIRDRIDWRVDKEA